ncbi:MAG: hypothetical protein VYA67_02905 [Actinomycetota bacterium]|uniref:Transmembrane protein n=1 Tax=Mycobacterium lentiflavum TaxID=141349 RepID=A0ABY3UUX1_MYCLN|nr:hypothetical protein [Mycobacterium lentiflavum]MEE3062899.1 hypothetical protein [Actinomycetota bacterium]ULP40814.1 hypothetical protein MJO58_17985 [Mycobacterium lentiflavum]
MTDQRYFISHEHTFRSIESRVLDQVWVSRVWRAAGVSVTAVSTIAALVWWHGAHVKSSGAADGVATVPVALLVAASVLSALALWLRRYRWCCAAAYCCGLGAVTGIGAFWWVRTGPTRIGISWLVLADLAVVTLTVGWLAVIVTPLERSQPDMRRHFARRRN